MCVYQFSLRVALVGAFSLQVLGLAICSFLFSIIVTLNFLITAISYNYQAFFERGITFAALPFRVVAAAFLVH